MSKGGGRSGTAGSPAARRARIARRVGAAGASGGRRGLGRAGPPWGVASGGEEPGALQRVGVLGDCGRADVEGGGRLGPRGPARCKRGEDRPPRRVGERREGGVEAVAV